MGEFSEAVFRAVSLIPRGRVATYGQIARLIGHPRSARYVGYALRGNPSPGASGDIPCHRVVFADGRICEGYQFGGPDVQRQMLQDEGVTFVDDAHVDLGACQWDGRDAAAMLAQRENTGEEAKVDPGTVRGAEAQADLGSARGAKAGMGTKVAADAKAGIEAATEADAHATSADSPLPPDAPTAPPSDFDWRAELGED